MAVIYLTKIWVNRMDTGEGVSGYTTPERTRSSAIAGDTRTYAGGRRRSVSSKGIMGEFGFQVEQLADKDVQKLEAWKGVTVQVRDHRGQRFVGTYYEVKILERPWTANGAFDKAMQGTPLYRAALILKTVSYVEGV